jgi:hypothetical protein
MVLSADFEPPARLLQIESRFFGHAGQKVRRNTQDTRAISQQLYMPATLSCSYFAIDANAIG